MEEMNNDKYARAKKSVDELKGFYVHATVYTLVNAFILINIYLNVTGGGGNFWQWPHFFTLFGWGIGLLFHGLHTFKLNPFLGKDWEQRQIEKFMEEDDFSNTI